MLNCLTAWDSLYMPLPPQLVTAVARGHAADLESRVGHEGLAHRRRFRERWADALFGNRHGRGIMGAPDAGAADGSVTKTAGFGNGENSPWRVPLPAGVNSAESLARAREEGVGGRRLRVCYLSSHFNHFALGRDMLHVLRLHSRERVESMCVSLSQAEHGQAFLWQGRIRKQCHAWVDAEYLSGLSW